MITLIWDMGRVLIIVIPLLISLGAMAQQKVPDTLLLRSPILNYTIINTIAAKVDSAAPYMRISKNTALNLSSSWQTVNFSPGATSQDGNLFPTDTVSGKQMVWYDTTLTNRLLKFNNNYNYNTTLYLTFTTVGISTRAVLQARFVIPNGNGAGNDFTFPFPNNGGYQDLSEATILNSVAMNKSFTFPLYINNMLRTNGMYLQLKLSNGLVALGTCTLNAAAFLVQQAK